MVSNNLSLYYFPLILAALFAAVGVSILVYSIRRVRAGTQELFSDVSFIHGFFGCTFLAVGLLLVGGLLTGPSPSERTRQIRSVLNARPTDVLSVEISPKRNASIRSLVPATVVVVDAKSIQEVCSALNAASPISPNHPKAIWQCTMRLERKTGTYGCVVERTRHNGCVLSFYSDGGCGWHYGSFRSDLLCRVLESLAKDRQ